MSLPPGWAEATLGQIAETRLGKMLDAAKNKGVERPYLRNVNVRWGGFDLSDLQTMRVTQEEFDALRVRDGDIFACEGGEPGRCAVWREGPREVVYQKALHRIRPEGDIDPDFLAKRIHVAVRGGEVAHLLTGTTIKHLPQVGLQKMGLQIPPVAEQHRIVAKLDALTARLARARAELHRTLELPQRLRTETLRLAFANIQNHAPLRSLTQFVTSGSRGWAKFYADEGPVFIRVGDVRRLDVRLDLSDVQRVQPPPSAEGARTSVRASDVVVTITADLGRVGVVPEGVSGYVNQHVALARPIDPSNGRWIAWYLASEMGQTQMLTKDRGVTKAGLGLDDIRDVRIPVLDARQRDDIVTEIEVRFARADRLEAEAQKALALIDRLEAAILAKAFRGELVTQDPNDEPASVLMERIRARRAAEPKAKRGRRPKLAS